MTDKIEIDLHFTNRCNLNCRHCIYEAGIDIGEVPIKTLNRMIVNFSAIGAKTIHIGGGEPLCRYRDLVSLVRTATESNVRTRLLTNGFLLTEEKLNKLVTVGLKEVLISVDGTERFHNILRNTPIGYMKAMKAVKLGIEAGLHTRVNSVLTSRNTEDLKDLLKITTSIPVNVHSFLYLTPLGRSEGLLDIVPTIDQVANFVAELRDMSEVCDFSRTKVQVQSGYINLSSSDPINYCRIELRNNALIYATGDVFPCVRFSRDMKYSLGNINEEDIIKIWKDTERWEKFRREITRPDTCKVERCKGGCRGLSLIMLGSMNNCDPRCTFDDIIIPSCVRRYVVVTQGARDEGHSES